MSLTHTGFHAACAWLADALGEDENAIICECVLPHADAAGARTSGASPTCRYPVQSAGERVHTHTHAPAVGESEDGCEQRHEGPAVRLSGSPIGRTARPVRVNLMTDSIYSSAWLRLRASVDYPATATATATGEGEAEPAREGDGGEGEGQGLAGRHLAMDASVVYSETHAVPQLFATFCDAETGEPATLAEWRACTGGSSDDDLPSSMEWHPVTRVPGVLWHVCDTSARMHTLLQAEVAVNQQRVAKSAEGTGTTAAGAVEGAASDPRLYVLAWLSAYLPKLGLRMQPAAYMRLRARLRA